MSRINCRGENYDIDLTLDYNCSIYRLKTGDRFSLLLTKTLSLDGTADTDEYNQMYAPTLADSYEYVMHGKVFKISGLTGVGSNIECYASFGGLLMCVKGESRNLSKLELDQRVYLLIRKIAA